MEHLRREMPGASDEYGTFYASLEDTLCWLDERYPGHARLCTMLGVFQDDATVPLDVIAALWLRVGGIADEGQAQDVLDKLADVQIAAYSSEVCRSHDAVPHSHAAARLWQASTARLRNCRRAFI
eukprot:1812283-Prymnesium_polylepis.1